MDKIQYKPWSIRSEAPMRADKKYYESIFSQGNGYMGLRGTLPEDRENKSYERCAFIAGVFDYIKAGITDMVNTPDYMIAEISLEGEAFNPLEAAEFSQELFMEDGTLIREAVWQTKGGRKLKVKSTRFLSLADVHTAAIRYELTPLNFDGSITVTTGIDTDISNQPIADDQMKQNDEVIRMISATGYESEEGLTCVSVKTNSSADIRIAYAFSLNPELPAEDINTGGYFAKKLNIPVKEGKTHRIDKLVSVYTSRECEKGKLTETVKQHAGKNRKLGFEELLVRNRDEWKQRWETADIEITGDDRVQSALRFNLFQLIQTNSSKDCTVNIGARGIMHGRYKGCYFWDTDIFMLPFYIGTNPEAAKNLVKYRYLMLEDARRNAKAMNLAGARYPWMCSIDGREQCESWDIGSSEVHVTADVAYAVDQYIRETKDLDFLTNYAVELYIETARYWVSRLTYDESGLVYNLLFVKGPDEYCGITSNNTYTNWLIRYNMKLALDGIDYLTEHAPDKLDYLISKLRLTKEEQKQWKEVIDRIKIVYREDQKLYMQDETFHLLEPLDITSHKTDEIPLYRKICFDRLQRYRVLKQADLLLLMIMLPEDFTKEQKQAAWDYYEPLTLHDSSLSYGVHSVLASSLGDLEHAEEYFKKSLFLDIENVMDNTGKEGLHFAAFGITWQAVIRGFAGLTTGNGQIEVHPALPGHWKRLRFHYRYQGVNYRIEIQDNQPQITAQPVK